MSELKRLRSLEDENRRLKQPVAQPFRGRVGQLGAQRAAGKKLLKPKVRKMAASYAIEGLGLSERRDCLLARVSPSAYRYRSERGDDDALRRRMRKLASERKRFGSPRLHIMLKRVGLVVNHKRTERIYNEVGLGRGACLAEEEEAQGHRWSTGDRLISGASQPEVVHGLRH